MEQFLKAVHDTYFTEKDRIQWVLMLKDEEKHVDCQKTGNPLTVDLTHFNVEDRYEIRFIPISPTLWYAKVGGTAQFITYSLKKQLKHSNFVLLEIAGVPSIRIREN
jgi:hypothetical protein